MADSNTTKAKTFRTEGETADRVDAWMERNGISNKDALKRMMDIVEGAEAKGALAGRATEVENFQSLVNQLVTAYTASLQLAENAENRIRMEFAKRISSQDDTIADLQARAKAMKDEVASAKEQAGETMKERNALQVAYDKQREELETQKAQATKAAQEVSTLRTQIDRLTVLTSDQADEIHTLKKAVAKVDELREKVKELTDALAKERESAQQAAGRAEEKLSNELEKAQMRQEAAVLEAQKAAQEDLEKVRKECQEAVAKAQATTNDIQKQAQEAAQKAAQSAQLQIEAAQARASQYQEKYEDLLESQKNAAADK